jgi:hypothetical protein
MISGFMQITPNDARGTSSTKNGVTLGSIAITRDGKFYAFTKAGAANLATGKLTVNADADANVVNKTVARTTAAGAMTVIVDAAGAVVADAYADGVFTVSDATGEGHDYLVVGNSAVAGAGEVTLMLAEPLIEALTIDVSEYTLVKSLYDGVVISATDQADAPAGVPNTAVTAAYYFWNQIRGRGAVLADEAVARGLALTTGTGVAGAVEALDAAGEPQIGVATEALVDTEFTSAFLSINI